MSEHAPPPAETNDPATHPVGPPAVDWLIMVATYLGAALVFFPLAAWVFQKTEGNEQLLHAMIVLAAAGFFLLMEKRRRLSLALTHDRQSVALLAVSFSLAAISILIPGDTRGAAYGKTGLLLAGFAFALGSLVRYTLGPVAARAARGFLAAFFVFMMLALLLPLLDWPLRALAGKWSLDLLNLIGQGGQLHLAFSPQPMLILQTGGQPFVVAAECNGFGLLSSSVLLTILLAVYRRLRPLDFSLVLFLALFAAFVANTVRILVIILLAPHVSNYAIMHELVGIVFFYGALAFLWWFIWGFGPQRKPAHTSKATASSNP